MNDLDTVALRAVKILREDAGGRKPSYVDGVTLGGKSPALIREGAHAYYPDINYKDKTVSLWQCRTHLGRLRSELASRTEEDDGLTDDDILAAVDFWLDNDFTNPNWWHNQIGTPTDLAAVCLLMGEKIGRERLERCLNIISRGSFSHNPPILKWTGANLLWGVRNTIYYALLTRDDGLLRAASERFAAEVTIAPGAAEGIKPDFSFYQHGPQLYSCGYGRAFTTDTAKLIYMLSGTAYSLPADKVRIFESFVLDGQRYFMRCHAVDYIATGREIARPGALSSGAIKSAISYMLRTAEFERRDALNMLYNSLDEGASGFTGTKYFEHSYFLSHNRPGFHMGVRGSHADLVATEWGNGENRLGCNLARGGNACFMADGHEYYDIAPVWDWSLLPGTTSPAYSDDELRSFTGGWAGPRGKNRDCAGCADGRLGALAMWLEGDGLNGYMAYIAFDDGMVILGCGITGPEGTHTAVDQCLVRGDIREGHSSLERGGIITNGGFKYVNLCGRSLNCDVRRASGSWKRVADAASDGIVTRPVVTLYYETSADAPSDIACAVLSADADPGEIAEIINTPERQGAVFADGRSVMVTRGADGINILIS